MRGCRAAFRIAMLTSMDLPIEPANRIIQIIVAVLGSDAMDAFGALWRLARRVLSLKTHEGMYEVLEYEVELDIQDPKGEKAILHKREKVRFLQDNIIAYHDSAWGDGEIFADYRCAPGVAVDTYREGHRYQILISLRETKNRNDIEEFRIDRTIKRGFTKDLEDLQIEIDHVTRNFKVSVVLPKKRFTKQVTLIERNAVKTTVLEAENQIVLPDGRQKVSWMTDHPRLFENYILHWQW